MLEGLMDDTCSSTYMLQDQEALGFPGILSKGRTLGTKGVEASAQRFTTPARQRPLFELPDNVSRRPRSSIADDADNMPSRRTPVGSWEAGSSSGNFGFSKRPAHAAAKAKPKARSTLHRKPVSGAERAAARKVLLRLRKRAVSRRVALWRSRLVDGERQTIYVTLAGEALAKSGRAYKQATADQRYLKSIGITSNKPLGSSIERPEALQPYSARRENDPRELSFWCVPESVEVAYRDAGVRRLYDWQAECLQGPGVLEGKPLVYVAPTSAGKSLVSEVLMLRQILFRGRRAILVLPFVSLCSERVAQLRRLWGGCGIRIEALYAASDGKWHAGADVAVCTIEKASGMLNRLLDDNSLLRDIGVIVVDELHLLGDEHRGYLLEPILIKARLSASMAAPGDGGLQIVGLSATLPNIETLASWLDAHLYISTNRPVPLSLSISSGGRILDSTVSESTSSLSASADVPVLSRRDPDGLVPLVSESLAARQGVLIFLPTKDWCEKAAALLSEEIPENVSDEVQTSSSGSRHAARQKLVEEIRQLPSGICPILARAVPRGVAYHHAGLTVEERSILEDGFRAGVLGCLCATSTLAAGVNLPCRRVVIRSLKVGTEALDATRFKQMAGRAGRAGLDTLGECIVLAKTGRDIAAARTLFESEMVPLRSSLYGQRLARAVLESVSLGLVRSVADLEGPFARTLLRSQEEHEDATAEASTLLEDIWATIKYLEERQLVRTSLPPESSPQSTAAHSSGSFDGLGADAGVRSMQMDVVASERQAGMIFATPLGDGVVHSALKPDEAISVFEDLQKARIGIRLDTDLHLIYLSTPVTTGVNPDWQRFLSIHERLSSRDRAVADAVGISHSFLMKQTLGHTGPISGAGVGAAGDWQLERERVTNLHRRFWAALALNELVREQPLSRVASTFGMARGALQSLQMVAVNYCGMVRQLCERLRWPELVALFESLSPRLNFGVAPELVPLCQIPGVYPNRARALVEAGLTSIEELARANLDAVEAALRRLTQFESRCADVSLAHRQEAVVRDTSRRIQRGAQELLAAQLQGLDDDAEDEQLRVTTT